MVSLPCSSLSCSKDKDYTPLHKACIKGDVTGVMRLVDVDDHMINAQDNIGQTPLHRACCLGHSDIVKTLILAGADETITSDYGRTPVQLTKDRGHLELLK